jgi:hypothetical protein
MYKRILVPIDGSATATRGLQEAIGLAADLKAELILLHVIDDFPLLVEMASAINVEATLMNCAAAARACWHRPRRARVSAACRPRRCCAKSPAAASPIRSCTRRCRGIAT